MTINQAQLAKAKNEIQHLRLEDQNLFSNYRALQALYADKVSAAVVAMTHNNGGSPLSPLLSTSIVYAIVRGGNVAEAATISTFMREVEARPGFAEIIDRVQSAVDEVERLEALDLADRRAVDQARAELHALELKMKDEAALRIAGDPELARLRAEIAEAEHRVSESTPLQDPAEAERQAKVAAALKTVRRKGEPLAVEAFAGDD
jgi:hypothetical protein